MAAIADIEASLPAIAKPASPLRLYLDTGNVKPAGYRLYLFFG